MRDPLAEHAEALRRQLDECVFKAAVDAYTDWLEGTLTEGEPPQMGQLSDLLHAKL